MRQITHIVIHCTATEQTAKIDNIINYWQQKLNWKKPGYHFIIDNKGTVTNLLNIEQTSNGVRGHNRTIINIAYIGGIDKNGKAIDNRTTAQKASILTLLKELKKQFPTAKICGHRDFPNVKKDCPSFDAKKEYQNI